MGSRTKRARGMVKGMKAANRAGGNRKVAVTHASRKRQLFDYNDGIPVRRSSARLHIVGEINECRNHPHFSILPQRFAFLAQHDFSPAQTGQFDPMQSTLLTSRAYFHDFRR